MTADHLRNTSTVPPGHPAATRYPAATRQDIVERQHGYQVADPYRWLEDPADPATERWSAAQDELAHRHLDGLPGRDWLTQRLTALLDTGSVSAPLWRGGSTFFSRRQPGDEHAKVYVRPAEERERVLLDPMAIDPTGTTTVDSWVPDLEGRRLAYQVSTGGDEESVLHVLEVATGQAVEPPIDRCRYSDVAWLPGGEEFYYVRKLPPREVPDGEEQFHRRVWRHRVGTPTEQDVLVEAPGLYDEHTYYGVRVSWEGRWLVLGANVGTARRDSVWLADLRSPEAEPVRLLAQADDVQAAVWVDRDGRMYVLTTDGAPRWRLCVADPERPGREHWRELVAEEPDSVLEGVRRLEAPGGDGEPLLVLLRARHAVSELALHAEDGTPLGGVPLPGTGSLTGLSTADPGTPGQRGRLWVGWTDLVTPPEVHCFDRATGELTLDARAPGSPEEPAPARVEQRAFTSADGTTVQMFVVSPASGPAGPRPALLTGYGGFALTREPAYTPSALAWVAAGGVWVLASLRGGGEEGEAWHRAGMREAKQNVFDDLHAAADALVRAGLTTHDRLAIQGGSNGGLLVGAALTQRPAAYRAVVCSAPLLDMVRFERFSLGRTWNDEYGSADVPEELAWLLGYSPYHHVREGTEYPAVLFTVFDSDSRVDPCHARKMCAALQHATAGDPSTRPILLRRETDVGHGARSVSRSVGLGVDQLAFLAAHTGLELP